jgi:hypothetical protein
MPICEPGDDCTPPPPGDGGGGSGGGGGDAGPSASDLYQVAVWEDAASDTAPGANPLDPIGSAISKPDGSAATGQTTGQGGSPTQAGCRTVTYSRTAKSILGLVLFRHNLRVYWCWSSPQITRLGVACFSSDVDSFAIQTTPCAIGGYYYTWNGNARGGHYSLGSGQYGNCVFQYGCWRSWVVNVEVWINANGTWTGKGG